MAYLTDEQLMAMGFKPLGKKVEVSDSARICNPHQIEIVDFSILFKLYSLNTISVLKKLD